MDNLLEGSVNIWGRGSLYLRNNNFLVKIKYASIQYVKSEGNYCEIHADKKYLIKTSLVKILVQLPVNRFVRIHQQYLVQIDLIDKLDISANEVYLSNTPIPLGSHYKKRVLALLNQL